jgi:lipopolysaccharide export system permease protein
MPRLPKPPKIRHRVPPLRQPWTGKGFWDHLGMGEYWQRLPIAEWKKRIPRLRMPAIPGTNIVQRYLFMEMLGPFFVSLVVATFVLFIAKVIELTNMVVSRGVGLDVVGRLLLYVIPYFLAHSIPMATMLAVLLGFMRLSADNEITALKSAGVSMKQLLLPVVALATLTWAVTTAFTIWAMPWGQHKFENLVFEVAQSRADLALKERVFLDAVSGLVIYVNRLPAPGALENIFVVDERDRSKTYTVVAKRGKIFPAKDDQITLRLYDGTIHNVGNDRKTAQNASFKTYDVAIDASYISNAQRDGKHAKEMYLTELYAEMKSHEPGSRKYLKAEIELQQKFALPMACFIMALIALPLGTHWKSGRSWGVGIGLAVFLGYYLIFSLSWNLGDTGSYPPIIGVWLPNVLFGLMGFELFRRELKEKPFPLLDSLDQVPTLLASFIQRGSLKSRDADQRSQP